MSTIDSDKSSTYGTLDVKVPYWRFYPSVCVLAYCHIKVLVLEPTMRLRRQFVTPNYMRLI